MNRTVGYCGIVCSDCPVFMATERNDDLEREKIALMFTQQYGKEYRREDINCKGCVTDNSCIFSYCKTCGIRKCGKERNVKNCAYCANYPCKNLSELFSKYSKAKIVLDEIRNGLSKN